MNRAPRAAAIGALLLAPVALSACSAGQVTQTNTQEQNFGAQINAGSLALRALELPYPTGGTYPSGSEARLLGAVVSTADSEDTLVGISGEAFEDVEVVDPNAEEPADGAAPAGISLPVPADGTLFLSNGQGPAVTLVGLSEELSVGEYIDVTFSFTETGDVTVQVPVGVSQRDLPRGEAFDFHPEEEEEQQGGGSAP
ncbi:copper chaperone PCu(A)C [Modestobacter sp. VKM Ac-2986]|uniref:copper chaperone PCu(A)C n=1 Tax=Modestobacter sp. VKM Ac-2986 TaxID=3004140 RepID=UPI0022AB8C2F|nr:copper chaperone PCu(A)C [Modestobacter sp. VKM Ac-2986]MCZ2830074.1 copper chaperone PCu(A)C [Modestobacter sp. VKM Ac-2986]